MKRLSPSQNPRRSGPDLLSRASRRGGRGIRALGRQGGLRGLKRPHRLLDNRSKPSFRGLKTLPSRAALGVRRRRPSRGFGVPNLQTSALNVHSRGQGRDVRAGRIPSQSRGGALRISLRGPQLRGGGINRPPSRIPLIYGFL